MCIFCELSSPFCCFQTAVDCQKNTRGLRPPSCFDAASAPACGVQGKMWELTIYKLEVLLGKSPNSIWWNSWFTELKDGDFPVRYVNLPEGTIGIYIGLILGTINQVRTGGPHLMGYFIGCVMISCWELCFLSPWCFLIGASWFGECYRMLHDLGSSENWDETTSNLMVCLWKWQKNCHVGRIRHFQAHQIAGDFLVSFDGDSNRCFKG